MINGNILKGCKKAGLKMLVHRALKMATQAIKAVGILDFAVSTKAKKMLNYVKQVQPQDGALVVWINCKAEVVLL